MSVIGSFIAVENGYKGTLETLAIEAHVTFERNTAKRPDSHPDYYFFAGSREIGAAWDRVGFLSVNIDDPSFPPANCTLKKVRAENRYQPPLPASPPSKA